MVKSVYVWNFAKKQVFCINEEHAKKEQKRGNVRIMPISEARTWIKNKAIETAKLKAARIEEQGLSNWAMEATEEEQIVEEVKALSPEEQKEELLSILVANGTVELKGSWYAYEGKNYRKNEILEVIG